MAAPLVLRVEVDAPLMAAAVDAGGLARRDLGRAQARQQCPLITVAPGRLRLPPFAEPVMELVRIEAPVAAEGQGRRRAVRELEERPVRADDRPRWVPGARHGAYAADEPAADPAHDVDLVRPLVQHDPTAALGVQLLQRAGPVHEVLVGP